jgi:hypothetical protein
MFTRFRRGKWTKIEMLDKEQQHPDYCYNTGACPEIIAEEPFGDTEG